MNWARLGPDVGADVADYVRPASDPSSRRVGGTRLGVVPPGIGVAGVGVVPPGIGVAGRSPFVALLDRPGFPFPAPFAARGSLAARSAAAA